MSIITFWNNDREQSGKTLTSVAVATKMAMEHNLKILLLSTSYKDSTMKHCFWTDEIQKNLKIFAGKNNNIAVENGIEGLSKLITSNKIQPSIITDYTKIVYKGRLEVLCGFVGAPDKTEEENQFDYKKTSECYLDLIKTANQYYDMVIVDLDNDLDEKIRKQILEISNLNLWVITQRKSSLDRYNDIKNANKELIGPKNMVIIGKYNDMTKFNKKNISRYLEEKKKLFVIPYNILYFEAAEEAGVAELFLRLNNIKDKTDKNYIFMEEIQTLVVSIINRLHELQMRKR